MIDERMHLMTGTKYREPTVIRLGLEPGHQTGHWVAKSLLLIRRPGRDVRSTSHAVTYVDREGRARREFGGPIVPGPWAFLTPSPQPDEYRAVERARDGDEILVGSERFVVHVTADDVVLRPGPDVNQTEILPSGGIGVSVARGPYADPDSPTGGVEGLVLVGTLEAGKRVVEPVPSNMTLLRPARLRPAVALEAHSAGSPGAILAAVPVLWSDSEFAYVKAGDGTFGGNYAAWSDGRVTTLVEEILGHTFYGAVAIHDRFE